jgi:hypothetical protein
MIDANELFSKQIKERVLLSMSNIQDKVVVIIGASSGIGEAATSYSSIKMTTCTKLVDIIIF